MTEFINVTKKYNHSVVALKNINIKLISIHIHSLKKSRQGRLIR